MIPATLISIFSVVFLFAGCVYGSEETGTEEEATKYASFLKSEIEKKFTIGNDLPYVEKNWGTKKCWSFDCDNARQFERYMVQSGKPVAYSKVSIDGTMLNPDSANTTVTVQKSIALMDSRSEGWTVGASLSGPAVELSASYSKLEVHSKTETDTYGAAWRCPPKSECRVETWTWHVELQEAQCKYPQPLIDCGGMHPACGGGLPCGETEYGASAFAKFTYEKCGSDDTMKQEKWLDNRDKVAACPESVKTPIHNAEGKAYTVLVGMYRPYSAKRAKRSELDLPLSSEWKIIPQE
jgi:hypothetical protein